MKRLDQWPERLERYIAEASVQTFAFGAHDCVLFAAGAVEALTGEDLARAYRGKYSSAKSAAKLAKKVGGGSIEDAVERVMGQASACEIAPRMAQRGDLVLLMEEEGATFAVVHPRGTCVVTVGREGLVQRPLSAAVRAWRI